MTNAQKTFTKLDHPAAKTGAFIKVDLVATHLVMNALNQIAAQEYLGRKTENSLLFALSDYLREIFTPRGTGISLRDEAQILEAQVELFAKTKRCVIQLKTTVDTDCSGTLDRGCAAQIACSLFHALEPELGGNLKMQIFLNGDITSGIVTINIQVQSTIVSHSFDLARAQNQLKALAKICPHLQFVPEWFQGSPAQLNLICKIGAAVDVKELTTRSPLHS